MNEDPDQIDRVLDLLASKERRKVIEYFDENAADTATVEVLSAQLGRVKVESGGTDQSSTDVAKRQLHHVHLPKLEEYGVVEYDPRAGQIRYRPDEQVESISAFLDEV
ncbi:DUF7344 domain-containing protein [Halorussus salinisoli]|uniref:DUF7344 domain-containing protein n=1 Tax=Halorussus salinisoli TaxID=2558242 RepID=UPI0010C1CCCA|nr:hypothetical protein [Halorussus salinisoli]